MKLNPSAFALLLLAAGCSEQMHTAQPLPTTGAPSPELKEVVKFTPAALAKVREVLDKNGKPYIRVSVISGGSTGFMYDMKSDDICDPKADYLNQDGCVKILVDMRSPLFLQGATIDWQTTPDGRQGFKFDNPNAVK